MFVTSRHTLDKLDSTLRETLSSKTEFLAAIRLPNTAFKKNAGTEVTTDIVMLRKLRVGESPPGPAWKTAAECRFTHLDRFLTMRCTQTTKLNRNFSQFGNSE